MVKNLSEELVNRQLSSIISAIEDEYKFAKFTYEEWLRRDENRKLDWDLREKYVLWSAGRLEGMEELMERVNRILYM